MSRKRRHFGSPCSFSKYSAENKDSYMEIVSQEDTNFELHRAEVDTAVQVRGRGRERGREREREGGRKEKRGREGEREREREGKREGERGREGGREKGREREGGREGGREGWKEGERDGRIGREGRIKGVYEDIILFLV